MVDRRTRQPDIRKCAAVDAGVFRSFGRGVTKWRVTLEQSDTEYQRHNGWRCTADAEYASEPDYIGIPIGINTVQRERVNGIRYAQ